jgi:hypothetical protein
MKTFGICSNCSKEHYWREIDYDNLLYINMDNAVCQTLCALCANTFLEETKNHNFKINYKQKINTILNKSKPILDFTLKQPNNNASLFTGLSF